MTSMLNWFLMKVPLFKDEVSNVALDPYIIGCINMDFYLV